MFDVQKWLVDMMGAEEAATFNTWFDQEFDQLSEGALKDAFRETAAKGWLEGQKEA